MLEDAVKATGHDSNAQLFITHKGMLPVFMAQFWQKLIHNIFIFLDISFKNAPMPFDEAHTWVNLDFYNRSGISTHSAGLLTLNMELLQLEWNVINVSMICMLIHSLWLHSWRNTNVKTRKAIKRTTVAVLASRVLSPGLIQTKLKVMQTAADSANVATGCLALNNL